MRNKKILAILSIFTVLFVSISSAYAVVIGEIKVLDDASMNTDIDWDGNYPINANGSVSGIKVKARIEPQIDMSISTKEIDLGLLTSATPSTGSLDIEVGTNAKDGVNVTVRSNNGGLENTLDSSIVLNNNTGNTYQSDYEFSSTNRNTGTDLDSSIAGFNVDTVLASTQIVNTTTEHVLYRTNKPENFENTVKDIQFSVSAQANSQAPAGEYEDLLTFTITGNF